MPPKADPGVGHLRLARPQTPVPKLADPGIGHLHLARSQAPAPRATDLGSGVSALPAPRTQAQSWQLNPGTKVREGLTQEGGSCTGDTTCDVGLTVGQACPTKKAAQLPGAQECGREEGSEKLPGSQMGKRGDRHEGCQDSPADKTTTTRGYRSRGVV